MAVHPVHSYTNTVPSYSLKLYRLPFHQQGTPIPDSTGAMAVIRYGTARDCDDDC
jgi:hypothetical protein